MNHVSLCTDTSPSKKLEFSHFDFEADVGHWKNENTIQSNSIKINLFIEGDFSMYIRGTQSRLAYGEICIFAPREIHRANVARKTRIRYYQLDIGENCFDGIVGGRELITEITARCGRKLFLPEDKNGSASLVLFERIEKAISGGNKPLAYALVLELLIMMKNAPQNQIIPRTSFLSKNISDAVSYLEEHYSQDVTLDELARRLKVSVSYLSRSFKKEIGSGIHEYLLNLRIAKASELLRVHSVTDTCYMCGFSDSSHFIAVFKKRFGVTPKIYKRINGF